MLFITEHFKMLFAVSGAFMFGLILGMMLGASVDFTGQIVSLDPASYIALR
ncbi:MAG: hypothetical protein AAB343_02305 [Patescibacteria group bacterium]